MPRKKGTLEKVGHAVKQAAETVIETADEYVVQPVGRALGLKKKRPSRPSPQRRKQLKSAAKAGTLTGKTAAKRRAIARSH
jgi:hypothetical protein